MAEQLTVRELADGVLSVLRHFRDNEPDGWNSMIGTESGALMTNMWDMLVSASKYRESMPDSFERLENVSDTIIAAMIDHSDSYSLDLPEMYAITDAVRELRDAMTAKVSSR